MNPEEKILQEIGKKNPFTVPENYFENFTQELMDKLPTKEAVLQTEAPTLWQRVKPWLYMAAMFCGIMLSVRIFVGKPQQEEFPISQAEAEMLPDEEWENFMRRAFTDNYETYQFLTNADENF